MLRLITTAILALLIASCSSEDPSGPTGGQMYKVSGTITTTETGESVAGVTLTLGSRTALTDSSGAFEFDSIATGSFALTPSKQGREFTPATRQVTITDADVSGMDFVMTNPNKIPDDSIQMVLIPAGTFTMGVDVAYKDIFPVAHPKHQVTLTRSYWIGIYEVTQAQWMKVMAENNSRWVGDNLPVQNVTWYEALEFCNQLSELHGFTRVYTDIGPNVQIDPNATGYRLPTEAEWEYAASAGDTSIWYGVDDVEPDASREELDALTAAMLRFAWLAENSAVNGVIQVHEVGTREPNAWGLYDTNGNLSEWAIDNAYPYTSNSVVDPINQEGKPLRMLRGSSITSSKDYRSTSPRGRTDFSAVGRGASIGVRIIRYE